MARSLAQEHILGFLATRGNVRNHEVAVTTGLAWLLNRSAELSSRVTKLLNDCGIELAGLPEWMAETRLDAGQRPDLEAKIGGSVVVRIEAKFGAAMTAAQLLSYLSDLASGLLVPVVLLHPVDRTKEAQRVVDEVLATSPSAVAVVVTWDRLFDALLSDLPEGNGRSNVEQLRSLAWVASALDVRPFLADDTWDEIAKRESDLETVADWASKMQNSNGVRWPLGRDLHFVIRRYFPVGLGATCAAVGVRDGWRQLEPTTPLWLRFHNGTPDIALIRAAWEAAGRPNRGSIEDGHLFFPLTLPRDVTGAVIEERLRAEIDAVVRAVAPNESPLPQSPTAAIVETESAPDMTP